MSNESEKHVVVKDIAALTEAYALTAPKLLNDQHDYLLRTLERLPQLRHGTLVVLGCGGSVLPYSCQYSEGNLGDSNRKRIKSIIGNGNIVFMDYIENELHKSISTLSQLGFFEDNYFKSSRQVEKHVSPTNLVPDGFTFVLGNLRDKLPIDDAIADAIDANLSLHHATMNSHELTRVYREIYRILKPNGLLHLGEGEVEMEYGEQKIDAVAKAIRDVTKLNVLMIDEREKDNGYRYYIYYDKDGKHFVDENKLNETDILPLRITEDGLVVYKNLNPKNPILTSEDLDRIGGELTTRKYGQILKLPEAMVIPLIDPTIPQDVERHISGINRYYEGIRSRSNDYKINNPSLYAKLDKAVDYERGNAARGTVEYYVGEQNIVASLTETGFGDINIYHHKTGPFYNITARKLTQNH